MWGRAASLFCCAVQHSCLGEHAVVQNGYEGPVDSWKEEPIAGCVQQICGLSSGIFFLLGRDRHDVWFLNDLADKHTIFSILNKGPWRHLSLPVSPRYETLFSCLSEMPVGTGPRKVLGGGIILHCGCILGCYRALPGVSRETSISQHPHLGQWEHWAPLLHQPCCKAFGHLQRAEASVVSVHFISNQSIPKCKWWQNRRLPRRRGPPAITCSRDNSALSASS